VSESDRLLLEHVPLPLPLSESRRFALGGPRVF
jgi:hypothetical protein